MRKKKINIKIMFVLCICFVDIMLSFKGLIYFVLFNSVFGPMKSIYSFSQLIKAMTKCMILIAMSVAFVHNLDVMSTSKFRTVFLAVTDGIISIR